MTVEITRAKPENAKRLADVFNASFFSDYVKYGECPGYGKTEETILSSMNKQSLYEIVADGIIVGSISVREESDNNYYLGALCVIPEYSNKGIGQYAMRFLDMEYANAVHWALETPTDKAQNHYFYKKFGYNITKEYLDGNVLISYFERHV